MRDSLPYLDNLLCLCNRNLVSENSASYGYISIFSELAQMQYLLELIISLYNQENLLHCYWLRAGQLSLILIRPLIDLSSILCSAVVVLLASFASRRGWTLTEVVHLVTSLGSWLISLRNFQQKCVDGFVPTVFIRGCFNNHKWDYSTERPFYDLSCITVWEAR